MLFTGREEVVSERGAAPSVSAADPAQAEQRRAKYGVWVVVADLALIGVLYLVTLFVFSSALPSGTSGGGY